MSDGFDELLKYQDGKSQVVEPSQDFGSSFEIASQTAETCSPGKRAFHKKRAGPDFFFQEGARLAIY